MTIAPASVHLTIPNQPEFVSVARLTVAGVASRMAFGLDAVEDIKIAVGEACTNCIEHASLEERGNTEIRIRCLMRPGALVIEVADEGQGFDPESVCVSADDLDPFAGCGLGLLVIRALMDEVELVSEPGGGTLVRFTKRLTK